MGPMKVNLNPAVGALGGGASVQRDPAREPDPAAAPPGTPGPEADEEREESPHEEAGYGYGV